MDSFTPEERHRIYEEEKARIETRRQLGGSPFAIAASVCALISLIIIPMPLGPIAILFGLVALARHEGAGLAAIVLGVIATIVGLVRLGAM
jgi:hypothetical protein